ncbi:Abi family protein [Corynebacterium diphtheriae]|uniref:Abi family protein n=1 Tax=Corynebacterium diphtheriae TaxID=1717 RepID=UPI00351E213D
MRSSKKRMIATSSITSKSTAIHPPVWAIIEYLSFDSLIQLISYLKTKDKRSVANKFGIRHPREFVTFVRAMVYLRNKCAHGSRLFNKPLKHTLKPLIFHVLG